MSKFKVLWGQKQSPKVNYSHHNLRGIRDFNRAKKRITEPSFMPQGNVSSRSTSMLTPRSYITSKEYGMGVQFWESPKIIKQSETSCKDAEKSEKDSAFVSKKSTTSPKCRRRSASPKTGKNNPVLEPLKNINHSHVERSKSPCRAVEKLEKTGPQPKLSRKRRKKLARKCTSSLAPRIRTSGGSLGSLVPSSESSKLEGQYRIKVPCKDAKKSDKIQFENLKKSRREPLKSLCGDARRARIGNGVSFNDPVAAEIPIRDPPFRINRSSESEHSTPMIIRENPTGNSQKAHKKSKRPLIVVPLGEGSKKNRKRSSSSTLLQHPANYENSNQQDSQYPMSSLKSKQKSFIPYSRKQNSGNSPEERHDSQERLPKRASSSIHHVDFSKDIQVRYQDSQEHGSPSSIRQCPPQSSPCGNCDLITDLSKQLGELTRMLEGIEKDQLPDIRQQVNSLKGTVRSWSEKCDNKGHAAKPASSPSREGKSLSTCQFCQGRNLPVLNSFKRQLKETIGHRSCTDVVLSIFLRADNIYHVNVRDLNSSCSLACFLVSDAGIEEAQQMGIFRKILTFSVIDVRNTLKPKNCAMGITFELVDSERQLGGCDTVVDRGLYMTCKTFAARVLGLPLHKLKHVYKNPGIFSNYINKYYQKHKSRIQQKLCSKAERNELTRLRHS